MEPPPRPPRNVMEAGGGLGITSIGEDILQIILSKLPALSFASAACVSSTWHRLCALILSRPKLLSALSLNPRLEIAVKETLDKVLSQPIRPHFAIACVGRKFSLKKTHQLVRAKLGSRIPIVVSAAGGIIGSDALTNEFEEVKWEEDDSGENQMHNSPANVNRGIVLIVGFMPGLKVNAIPLLRSREEPPQEAMMNKFVMDIKDYTASISGCSSPTGILMFADQNSDMKPVLHKMDYALSEETVIVGDESGCFLYSSGDDSLTSGGSQGYFSCKNTKQPSYGNYNCDAVALVFARDRGKPHGLGEIQFHLALSTGVSPVGPTYKGASVRVNKGKESACSTWLTARREGFVEKFDGQRILHDIDDEMGNGIFCDDLYIGVVKRRKCSIGSEKGRLVSSLAFHEVLGGDEEYLYVKGNGIKTGDPFRFYHPDPKVALTSRNNVFEDFRILKQDLYCKGCHHVRGTAEAGERKLVFGGLVFSCYGRGESFFGCPKVDSLAFLEDFPGIPLAGMFCGGEIGRGFASSAMQYDSEERSTPSCCLHVYSTVYLVMLYTSKSPEC
ncbi:PREDICTED: F-box/LRR-repeat protein At5g63520 isoform X2 [Nelumbo nucifera]|uniref:F-box/LRR-repeat protein At5g63520 isoform X2 n=1 Tax=Nelumbo nucifera TaxID=4432 RepID=A0A1U7ZCU5_NELNU|nr:PREDICTED: F-box/LRR-repeat protein At5g63520 isoform X2 [Nelumbo nucifera]